MKQSIDTKSLKQKAKRLLVKLREAYPDAKCSLDFRTPLQLMVSTILSAQCTDERVNKVTKDLFRRYRTAEDFAESSLSELEGYVRSTGFYKNKAKAINASCEQIVAEHGSNVPEAMDDLVALNGVGRKTANVILGNAFDKAEGVVVDTHVKRITQRLGLTTQKTPEKIEEDLMEILPKKDWVDFSHILIYHGRKVCKAPKPKCNECIVQRMCPSADEFLKR